MREDLRPGELRARLKLAPAFRRRVGVVLGVPLVPGGTPPVAPSTDSAPVAHPYPTTSGWGVGTGSPAYAIELLQEVAEERGELFSPTLLAMAEEFRPAVGPSPTELWRTAELERRAAVAAQEKAEVRARALAIQLGRARGTAAVAEKRGRGREAFLAGAVVGLVSVLVARR